MVRRPTERDLDDLRQEVARLDRSLVLLLGARFSTVEEIFRLKRREGRPLEDRRQEEVVLARARGWARDLGLPPRMVDRVFEQVIATGKLELGGEVAPEPEGDGVVSLLLAVPNHPSRRRSEPGLWSPGRRTKSVTARG